MNSQASAAIQETATAQIKNLRKDQRLTGPIKHSQDEAGR